jgi:hypothetical protein
MPGPRNILLVTLQPERRRPLADQLRELGYRPTVAPSASGDSRVDLAVVDVVDSRLWSTAEDLVGGRLLLIVDGPAGLERGFRLGADDCVVDDARIEEIAARCEAVMRRTGEPPPEEGDPAVYADRRLWINFDSRQVWVGGRPVQLTPREFRLLRELIQHRDRTLSHDELLAQVWSRGAGAGRTPEVLKQYVWRLRQKIEPDPNEPTMIVTDPGSGYRFVTHGR